MLPLRLREAREEVGLHTSQLEILCEMERTVAVGGLLTGIVVALLQDSHFEPKINPGKVAAAFTQCRWPHSCRTDPDIGTRI